MGGDGGTISSNRTYLRGAGKACHTADHPSNAFKRSKAEDVERARSVLSTCAVSGAPLDLTPAADACGKGGGSPGGGSDIVACPHGNLYRREKALEALLQRRRPGRGDGREGLGPHVRGMRDLHPVRFHVAAAASSSEGAGTYAAACPIAGSDISSGNIPSFVIVRAARKSKDKEKKGDGGGGEDEAACGPNVLSERAIKEMGVGGLQEEYGPFEEGDLIRLAPPTTGGVFEGIRRRWEAVMKEEEIAKLKKKKDKKRKGQPAREGRPSEKSARQMERRDPDKGRGDDGGLVRIAAANEARSAVQSAVARNPVLSSLFGDGKEDRRTERKKKEDLFTRNC